MNRRKIAKITLEFEDGKSHDIPLLDSGEYKYTALFWDNASVGAILANYYPRQDTKLLPKFADIKDRKGRGHFEAYKGGSKMCDVDSVFPQDVVHVWNTESTRPDNTQGLPWAMLKLSQSPFEHEKLQRSEEEDRVEIIADIATV